MNYPCWTLAEARKRNGVAAIAVASEAVPAIAAIAAIAAPELFPHPRLIPSFVAWLFTVSATKCNAKAGRNGTIQYVSPHSVLRIEMPKI